MNPWLILGAVLSAIALSVGGFFFGKDYEGKRRDADELVRQQDAQKEFGRLIEVNYRAGTQLVHVIERERVITRTLTEKINVFLPAEVVARECPRVPGGFRVLHDAAADGADPAAAAGGDAPGPTPEEVTATVAENYGACRITARRLSACQAYITDVVRPVGLAAKADEP
jgi:hypothetical protein